MEPSEILASVRKAIEEHAQGDPDSWWYANRYVFARLMLDERRTKTSIKRVLLEQRQRCHFCGEAFDGGKGIPLHRLDESRGYSDGNCVLAHQDCHEKHHADQIRKGPVSSAHPDAGGVLTKHSKRYEGPLLYWWDVAPALAEAIDRYEAVEFVCDDTKASCLVPISVLKPLLTVDRKTSRGAGNWGIKVRKNRECELAIEPGTAKGEWTYVQVVWIQEEAEG